MSDNQLIFLFFFLLSLDVLGIAIISFAIDWIYINAQSRVLIEHKALSQKAKRKGKNNE